MVLLINMDQDGYNFFYNASPGANTNIFLLLLWYQQQTESQPCQVHPGEPISLLGFWGYE